MRVNKINEIMKEMAANSNLESNKHITNHSAEKTQLKKLNRSQVAKSDIITITGFNNKGGLEAYDSGDKLKQAISNIDNINP